VVRLESKVLFVACRPSSTSPSTPLPSNLGELLSCWDFFLDLTWRIVGDFVGLDLRTSTNFQESFFGWFWKIFWGFFGFIRDFDAMASIYSSYVGSSYFGYFERNKVTLKSGLP